MKLLDIMTSPWAIRREKMAEIRNIYQAHLRGPKIDWKEMQSSVALILGGDRDEEPYQVMNGVAVIPVKGVLTKGISFFSFLFGGSSMKQIGIAFQAALDDQSVKAILLDVDSPGGTVDGTEELAEAIFKARGQKPIIAYTDGTMASAAYWIASAADEIYISGDTVDVGSIGVVATHIDQSKYDEMVGDRYTEITAGRYKRIASSHRPLTDEGAAYIQDQVDYIYDTFVNAIARNRGVEQDSALAMADGRLFIGKQALEVGLVDGVEAFSDLINSAEISAGQRFSSNNNGKEEMMDKNELKTKHPELYQSVLDEGRSAGVTEGIEQGKKAGAAEARKLGADEERQRIKDVRAQLLPGHEALIDEMAMDGKTTGPEAATRVLAAEKAKLNATAKELESTAVKPVAQAKELENKKEDETFEAAVDRLVAAGLSRGKAIAKIAQDNPKLHEEYIARVNRKEAK